MPGSPGQVIAQLMPNNIDGVEVSWQPSDERDGTPVTGYVVRCVEDSSLTVSVDASSFAQSTQRKYQKYCLSCSADNTSDLQFCTECGQTFPTTQSGLDEEPSYIANVRLLAVGQSYSFTVSAISDAGESAPSSPSNYVVRRYPKYCRSCGTGNEADLQFCNTCGEIQIAPLT